MTSWRGILVAGTGMLLALGAMLGAAAPPARAETAECATPAELDETDPQLPHLLERIKAHQPATIVAIGGASTIGQAAGSPDLAYPHLLELDLAQTYPGEAITVLNKGTPRQAAKQMLDRFAGDVFPVNPALVIWEVGVNDAVRGTDVDAFAETLRDGVEQLKNRAIDIILMDMQFSRGSTAVVNFEEYLKALHRVGDVADVYVFPRFEMMRYWSEQNVFNFDDVADADRAKLAARVYGCLAEKLTQAIRRAVP